MRRTEAGLLYAPTDLSRFLTSPFASWMERLALERPGDVDADEEDEALTILARKGHEHEATVLERLRASGRDVVVIPDSREAAALTAEALRQGAEVIYQGRLEGEALAGLSDFLVRGAAADGASPYEVWDAKLARSPKVEHLVQLAAYADLVEQSTGRRPHRVGLFLGSGEGVAIRTDDVWFHYLRLKAAFFEQMAAFDPDDAPLPQPGEDFGRWSGHAESILEARDHLCRVAGIRTSQMRKLEAEGVDTLTKLATTTRKRIPKLDARIFDRLRRQARLQVSSAGKDVPDFELVAPEATATPRGLALLPPASPGDVFFDMEGYPLVDGGLEYLFGATIERDGVPEFHDFWAFDAAGEKRAFEAFVDWVLERRRRYPDMHVYHYAPYETSALKRLMGRHATREDEIDDLLRHHVFVDLYAVVNQGLVVGEPSYSLKSIERLYRRREGEVSTAMESVVYFERWLESGDPPDWRASKPLEAIRDYNRIDCESTWQLASWLRARQAEAGIAWQRPGGDPPEVEVEPPEGPALDRRRLAERLLADLEGADEADERTRIQRLLAHLLEFHRREEKPVWWSFFERHGMTTEQHVDDATCIGGARRHGPPVSIRRSIGFHYTFDAAQDTKVRDGSTVYVAGYPEKSLGIETFDPEGELLLRGSRKAFEQFPEGEPPAEASLLLHELVRAEPIPTSLFSVASRWADGETLPAPLGNLLRREPPRVKGHRRGPLVGPDEDVVEGTVRVVRGLKASTLCVQGPPGTGKTFVGGHAIAALVRDGKNVGVVSNGHEAIFNLLAAANAQMKARLKCLKVGGDADHPFYADCPGAVRADGGTEGAAIYDGGLVGGTAWFFSREDMRGRIDTLFVDEAGQVSLANLVAMAPSTTNIVLLGDQMQLPQPLQGSHPGESGSSALEYALAGHATVPPEMGIFLPTTWRLHPSICSFISGAFYEDRLAPEAHTVNRVVRRGRGPGLLVPVEAGIVFSPVDHEGNTQASEEEVERIVAIVDELQGRSLTDEQGAVRGKLGIEDILFIAPYNMQVRRLRQALPEGARVASVDKFQGQQAPVVIVSLCASPGESGPRGLGFVLDKHRLNVAVSRAQSLAIVVGDPRLALAPVSSVDDLRRQNLLCRLLQASPQGRWRRRSGATLTPARRLKSPRAPARQEDVD